MASKNISREKIISAFLFCAFDKNVGATSLQDIAEYLGIKKASLYNHFQGRDEMYAETLAYCGSQMEALNFIPENFMKLDLFQKKSLTDVFNTLLLFTVKNILISWLQKLRIGRFKSWNTA